MCPHKRAFVLEHGIIGDDPNSGSLYVSCTLLAAAFLCLDLTHTVGPMHKRNYALTSGECLNDESYSIPPFDVKVGGDDLLLQNGVLGGFSIAGCFFPPRYGLCRPGSQHPLRRNIQFVSYVSPDYY